MQGNHFIQLGFKNKFSYVRLKEMQGVHSFADIGRIFGLVAKKEKKSQHGLDHFHIMHLFSIQRFMQNQQFRVIRSLTIKVHTTYRFTSN